MDKNKWLEESKWEQEWHGSCVLNSFNEESKQYMYATRIGLDVYLQNRFGSLFWDLNGKSVVDIGGGPYSMLLKTENVGELTVVDPCDYPNWVHVRYAECGINFISSPAEDVVHGLTADEVWIYNCLQHVIDPEKIIQNALSYGKIVRIFEWIDAGVSTGHPHDLKEKKLNKWLGGIGKVEFIDNNPYRKSYYGVFKGSRY